MARLLRLKDFAPEGDWYHIARATYRGSETFNPHTHDFTEVFWIEAGQGVHQINDQRIAIRAGDVILVRPQDTHDLRGSGRRGLTLVNVAFDTALLKPLRQRCFDANNWPWAGNDLPRSYHVGVEVLDRLKHEANRLAVTVRTRLSLERFLFTLLDELTTEPSTSEASGLPDWLATAITKMRDDPEALLEGVVALASLAKRTREHVARTVREHQDRTTTELINALRLERAAQLLTMSDSAIVDVAIDAGIPNLAHFYKLFKARYQQTPRRYRLAAKAVVR